MVLPKCKPVDLEVITAPLNCIDSLTGPCLSYDMANSKLGQSRYYTVKNNEGVSKLPLLSKLKVTKTFHPQNVKFEITQNTV